MYNQRYQVENMPQPKSFTFYNSLAVPNEILTVLGTEATYTRHYHRLTGNPIPVANREGLNISMGFGYATDRLDEDGPLLRDKNQALWVNLYTTGSIGENYYWRAIYAAGTYEKSLVFKDIKTYKQTLLAQFGRKWSNKLATSIGFIYLSNFDNPQIVPAAHISYSSGKWVIDMLLPNEVNIRYVANKNFHVLFINNIIRRSYYDLGTDVSYKFSINEAGLQLEHRLFGVFWAELAVTKPYGLKTEIVNNSSSNELGDVNQTVKINAGLFVRFQQVYDK